MSLTRCLSTSLVCPVLRLPFESLAHCVNFITQPQSLIDFNVYFFTGERKRNNRKIVYSKVQSGLSESINKRRMIHSWNLMATATAFHMLIPATIYVNRETITAIAKYHKNNNDKKRPIKVLKAFGTV